MLLSGGASRPVGLGRNVGAKQSDRDCRAEG